MRDHLRRWGAAYVLTVLFLGSWFGQFITQVVVNGESLSMFFASTFENWQSEWFQLLIQAVLLLGLKHVLFRADADDMERLQDDVTEIKTLLLTRTTSQS